jgi:PPOX class probable F420-dependent enzyme
MPENFDERARRLLDAKNFATVATLNPDGSPHTSVVWFRREDDTIVITAIDRRHKVRNLRRDPRVSVSVFDLANPYESIDIRGTASVTEDPERSLSKALSHKYLDEDPPAEPPEVVRVIVRITPEHVTYFSA